MVGLLRLVAGGLVYMVCVSGVLCAQVEMSGVLVVFDGSAVGESWPVRPDVVVPVVLW